MKGKKTKTTFTPYDEEVKRIREVLAGGYISVHTALNLIMNIKKS